DLSEGTLTLSGTVPSQSTKDAVDAAAAKVTSTVVDHLTLPQPVTPSPQQVQASLTALPQVTFQTASATLTPEGQAVVAQAATILAANPAVHVRIEGHTDSTGGAAANLALSQARALTVLNTLQSLGIAADRMTAIGYGSTRPKVPDTTPANMA